MASAGILEWTASLRSELEARGCRHCGGSRKRIAFLTDGLVVPKLLSHLGLPTETPVLAPARAPPEPGLAW
jgi:hypothetical protein